MALTLRTNGSSGVNLVTASWWNDYFNLFTGSMTDQLVTLKNTLDLKAIGPGPTAPTLALASGTSLGIGAYTYWVTFVSADGESVAPASVGITTTTNNQVVSISAIQTGPAGTTARNIYRTKTGNSGVYLLTTIADNTTTTFTDNIPDSSLGLNAGAPHSSYGGAVKLYDSTGLLTYALFNDGYQSVLASMARTGPPFAPTLALAAGTTLGVGAYQYAVTFVDGLSGETVGGTVASITTTTNNQAVNLSNIALGRPGTAKRNIYRTDVGGSTFFLLTTLNDNTTTTYSDTTADGSLGTAQAPTHPSFGGLQLKNANGGTVAQWFTDGTLNIQPTGAGQSGYDAIYMHGVADQTYQVNLGMGDLSFGSGAGFYAYDTKNNGFIFKNGTKSGITFTGVVQAAQGNFQNGTNAIALYASATNDQGNRLAQISNVATSGHNSDFLDLIRATNQAQTVTFGIDSSNGFYIYDATAGVMLVSNARGVAGSVTQGRIPTMRSSGGNSGVAIFVGTTDPGSNAGEGDIWIDA